MDINELAEKAFEKLKKTPSGEVFTLEEFLTPLAKNNKSILKDAAALKEIDAKLQSLAKKEKMALENISYEDFGDSRDYVYMLRRKVNDTAGLKEQCIKIKYKSGGYLAHYDVYEAKKDELSKNIWETLLETVFDKCKVLDWYDVYIDPFIMDGYAWTIELFFKEAKTLTFYGSNAQPGKLWTLINALKTYGKSTGGYSYEQELN